MNEPTVLIVEDDESLRLLFAALLQHHGFATHSARNGTEAIASIARRPYDVVVLDLMMPVTTGFDVLRHFAEHTPSLLRRTIITTGVTDKSLNAIDRDSVFAIIRKPFEIDHLVTTVGACAAPAEPSTQLHCDTSRRFDAIAPDLRKILRDTCASPEESLLRQELRSVAGELGSVLEDAAGLTTSALLAHDFGRMAVTARELAGTSVRGVRRDH
jgi:DNA-binding NtrC family response regulator